jgi:hypothetical protein
MCLIVVASFGGYAHLAIVGAEVTRDRDRMWCLVESGLVEPEL